MEADEIKKEICAFLGSGPLVVHDVERFVDGVVDLVLDYQKNGK